MKQAWQIGDEVVFEEKKLSEGAFAYVMLSRNPKTGREYALKKILCPDNEAFNIALHEVEVMASLDHPNIIQYYGYTVVIERHQLRCMGLLMELMPCGHLLDFLDRHNGKLHESVIISSMSDITSAVFYLHARSPPIQHRDLKVENILLGPNDECKLCDFGSCSTQVVDTREADHRTLVNLEAEIQKHTTPMYRPPEFADVYQHLRIYEAVDCWMLGCILYILMFYSNPFQEASTLAVANAKYTIPEQHRFKPKLIDLIRSFLQLVPEDRLTAAEAIEIMRIWDQIEEFPQRATAEKKEKSERKPRKEKKKKARRHEEQAFADFPFPSTASTPLSHAASPTNDDSVVNPFSTASLTLSSMDFFSALQHPIATNSIESAAASSDLFSMPTLCSQASSMPPGKCGEPEKSLVTERSQDDAMQRIDSGCAAGMDALRQVPGDVLRLAVAPVASPTIVGDVTGVYDAPLDSIPRGVVFEKTDQVLG